MIIKLIIRAVYLLQLKKWMKAILEGEDSRECQKNL